MPRSSAFTVCVLLYGDYPELARRCLGSLTRFVEHGAIHSLRIGCNATGAKTDAYIAALVKQYPHIVFVNHSTTNRLKYPVMRELFTAPALETEFTVWFDDDSWIQESAPADYFVQLAAAMRNADMVGSLWKMQLRGKQAEWVCSRKWYTGKPVAERHVVKFATGGWWTIRTEVLRRWSWPEQDIRHRGGDVMLGELCRQQELRLVQFTKHVAINADDSGVCSSSKRRGYDEDPVGVSGGT